MSITTILILIFFIAALGITIGILKRNKVVLIISIAMCILTIAFALFLVFVLIPAM
ncbi:hypothetical protein ACN077_09325 [Clostridium chromiireducens]|uniref:Uncharacterized protein n=1 Tax=Clostridium chromiireducens TaxID=225345 RepID=A0A964W3P5_9CLOT|nr:hypothetical protein [Clostridium chromiireducens]MVX65575.1 hypothetical protein [Clostridium chromiireducens]